MGGETLATIKNFVKEQQGEGFVKDIQHVDLHTSDILSEEETAENLIQVYPEPVRRQVGSEEFKKMRDIKVYLADMKSTVNFVVRMEQTDKTITQLIESDYVGAIVIESPDIVMPCWHTQYVAPKAPVEQIDLVSLAHYSNMALGIEMEYPKTWFIKSIIEKGQVRAIILSREKVM